MAVWPPGDVVDRLAALPRPDLPGLRWTTPEQWHVTLRFLGEVEAAGPVAAALAAAPLAPAPAPVAMGPALAVLGGHVLVAPVAGLEEVAGAVARATAGFGEPPDARPFRGHVTLARARRHPGASRSLRAAAGAGVSARWRAAEATLVRSHLGRAGARYEVVARVALGAGPPPGGA